MGIKISANKVNGNIVDSISYCGDTDTIILDAKTINIQGALSINGSLSVLGARVIDTDTDDETEIFNDGGSELSIENLTNKTLKIMESSNTGYIRLENNALNTTILSAIGKVGNWKPFKMTSFNIDSDPSDANCKDSITLTMVFDGAIDLVTNKYQLVLVSNNNVLTGRAGVETDGSVNESANSGIGAKIYNTIKINTTKSIYQDAFLHLWVNGTSDHGPIMLNTSIDENIDSNSPVYYCIHDYSDEDDMYKDSNGHDYTTRAFYDWKIQLTNYDIIINRKVTVNTDDNTTTIIYTMRGSNSQKIKLRNKGFFVYPVYSGDDNSSKTFDSWNNGETWNFYLITKETDLNQITDATKMDSTDTSSNLYSPYLN